MVPCMRQNQCRGRGGSHIAAAHLMMPHSPQRARCVLLPQVLRITYDGYNRPGGGARTYAKGMACEDVHGQLK